MGEVGPAITEPIVSAWGWLKPLAIAAIGALAGAAGGAIGAQKIAERSKRKDEFLREIRSVNAAITVCSSVCHEALELKKSQVKPHYEQLARDVVTAERLQTGKSKHCDDVEPDGLGEVHFPDIQALSVPVDTIKNLLFEKVSCQSRAIGAFLMLERASNSLQYFVAKRKRLMDQFKLLSLQEMSYRYLGWKEPDGVTHKGYPNAVEGIRDNLDSVIFFSELLTQDLMAHGGRLRGGFSKEFDDDAPRVASIDYSDARDPGLMPPEADYADWLSGFREASPDESNR